MGSKQVAILAIALILGGCQTRSQQKILSDQLSASKVAWICEAFLPIKGSDTDDLETIGQISEHNAVWNALCAG
jgi:uncharacterized lipoprotein YajG